jgi:hypothetical protein
MGDDAEHLGLDRVVLKGPAADTALGRIDPLFELLTRLQLATPDRLRPYVDAATYRMKCPGVAADAPPVLGVFQTGRSGREPEGRLARLKTACQPST